MIVKQLAGNLADLTGHDGIRIERVRLSAHLRDRAVQRVTSDHGTTVGLRLPRGTVLADGDILIRDGERLVVVAAEVTPVIVIRPRNLLEMGRTAHALGNRHLQAQFHESLESSDRNTNQIEMIVPDDHTVVDFLLHHDVPFERTERVLQTPFRHAEHRH
jgi:urease accessory protein